MARQGLRTLCYGSREITNWSDDIDPQDIMPEEIERDLHLLCVTGVEDLLQDDVKSCIEDFRHAGISVWMLTGDKGLTAQEIGVSCGLISEEAKHATAAEAAMVVEETQPTAGVVVDKAGKKPVRIFTFTENDTDVVTLAEEIKEINALKNEYNKYQVVISGVTIALVLRTQSLHDSIGEILLGCESAIVYRSSPAQKADVVNFMKSRTNNAVTAAIGDGANDVNMIQ